MTPRKELPPFGSTDEAVDFESKSRWFKSNPRYHFHIHSLPLLILLKEIILFEVGELFI